VIDELHGFAKEKRGDLLALSIARLGKLAPGLRRVGLSATISDPDAYRSWLAPDADLELVDLVIGDPGAEPQLSILIPEGRIPWGGHSGRHAAREVMALIAEHKTTLVFCNTRSLAELIFQDLWAVNEDALPIGIHHGSLAVEARRRVENAMAEGRLRGLVATASLDLGIDWGDVDLVVQMGAPKGSSRLLQRIGRANHRLDEPSKGEIVPGNRFEYLEARAALDAIDDGELDPEQFRPGALDVLAQHILAVACAGPFHERELLAELRSAAPYAGLKDETFAEVLNFIATGGYALKAYDRFRRLVAEGGGMWRIARPTIAQQHRLNAGVIVEAPLLTVRFRNGRKLGTIEEGYAATLAPGDHFYFSGLSLEVEQFKDIDIIVRASSKTARIVTYAGSG
jgi:ATP-dependent Lhr-like helicase